MIFFLDHDVPNHLQELLKRHGHEVTIVKDVMPPNASDEKVFQYAISHNAIMVSCNRNDFLQLAACTAHHGLIILIRRRTPISAAGHLLELLLKAGPEGLEGNINFA